MALGKQYAGMWTLSQQMQAVSGRTWTGIPAVPSLWSWGRGHVGQMGNNTNLHRSSPVQVDSGVTWTDIDAGNQFTGAVKSDGTLWLWGGNTYGGLGNGLTTDLNSRSSPVQLGTATDWSIVSIGNYQANAIKTNGTLWFWGDNSTGESGTNETNSRGKSSPVQVGALTNWAKIVTLNSVTVAIKTDGTLWAWGGNAAGQVGNNTIVSKSSPVQIGAGTDWYELAGHSKGPIAQKTNGTIWTWGPNNNDVDTSGGILGLNDTIHRSSPVQIGADTDWVLAEKGNANSRTTLLRKTNGSLWGFGYNSYGTIGHNFTGKVSSPVQVGALTTWSKVTVTSGAGLAVKTDGTLWSQGGGADYGQLGNNLSGATSYRSSPVQVGTGTQWTDVYGGFQHVLALQSIPGT